MPNTQPPTNDYESKLDTILDTHFEHGAFNPATNGEKFKVYQKSYRDEAKQVIISLLNTELDKRVAYVIGEDKEVTGHMRPQGYPTYDLTEIYRNELRKEQRARLASLKENI